MAPTWRVAHRITWSVLGTLFNFAFFMTLLSLLVTVLPIGLVVEERREIERVSFGWVGVVLLAVPWALLVRGAWRSAIEQYRDLFGAERIVEGAVEKLEVRGRGSRRRFAMLVNGEGFLVPLLVFRTLQVGLPVRMRVTRFNSLAKEISVPELAS